MVNGQKTNSFSIRDQMNKLVSTLPEFKDSGAKAKELVAYIKPQIYWAKAPINIQKNGEIIVDQGQLIIKSTYVTEGLRDCLQATVLTATIGEVLPNISSKAIQEGRFWEGAIADAIGSYGIETLVETFSKHLAQTLQPQGLFPTLRFSPGYGDWSLEDQRDIVNYLEAQPIVKVNSSYMLEPVKSITALIGWSGKPQSSIYPQGHRGSGLCQGQESCGNCQTWACMK